MQNKSILFIVLIGVFLVGALVILPEKSDDMTSDDMDESALMTDDADTATFGMRQYSCDPEGSLVIAMSEGDTSVASIDLTLPEDGLRETLPRLEGTTNVYEGFGAYLIDLGERAEITYADVEYSCVQFIQ